MVNFVKTLIFFINIALILIITLEICETGKRDFQLKNLFSYFKKGHKKNKSKNNDILIIHVNGQEDLTTYNNGPLFLPIPIPIRVSH
jgi:hypothetical protein